MSKIQMYSNTDFNDLSLAEQRILFDEYRDCVKWFKQKKPFTIKFDDDDAGRYHHIQVFVDAAKAVLPSLKNYQVSLKMYYRELAKPDYRYLNENIINDLDKFFFHTDIERVKVSEDNLWKIYDLYD